jgi:carboxyl-terminal processing protease
MNAKRFHVVLLMLISALLGYYIGVTKINLDWKNYKPQITAVNTSPPAAISSTADFSKFWTVWEKIENTYYDKKAIDAQKLLNGAITGMVASLEDPYTVYLPPARNDSFKQELAGKFEGIGAELGMTGKQIIVVAPLEGSPAQKAGIRPGDAILEVNNQVTNGWTLGQAVEKIRGEKGTEVVLTVVHKGGDKAIDTKIIRDTITVKSVEGWARKVADIEKLSDGFKKKYGTSAVAYVRLSQFGDNTNQEWLNAINELELEMKQQKTKGIILDLRNNPGGYLTDAAFVSSEFLKKGVIVIQEKGSNKERTNLSVSRTGLLTDTPVVVLINRGSASASEIVAGALRDHGRAKLIGETSFGKGTIQIAEDIGDGAGLHVTIAKWLTPKEIWVHGKGLKPDIEIENDIADQMHDKQLEKAIEELVK